MSGKKKIGADTNNTVEFSGTLLLALSGLNKIPGWNPVQYTGNYVKSNAQTVSWRVPGSFNPPTVWDAKLLLHGE